MSENPASPKPFRGTVYLKDWLKRGGKSYIAVVGLVSIHRDEELVGFRVKGNESNWVARVAGGSHALNILGCQIRAIEEGQPEDLDEALAVP